MLALYPMFAGLTIQENPTSINWPGWGVEDAAAETWAAERNFGRPGPAAALTVNGPWGVNGVHMGLDLKMLGWYFQWNTNI